MEGRVELQVEGPHGGRIARHLIEVAGFLDRPRRGREAGAFDIDLARLCPLPQSGGGGVDPDRAGGLGLVHPQEVRHQEAGGEVRGRDAEGPLPAAVQGGEALLDLEQVSSWIEDRDSITPWPRARSSSRFPTIWERLPWSPSIRDSISLAPGSGGKAP